jgi:5'-3' exonuclease
MLKLLEHGIKPIVVFDGKPERLKAGVLVGGPVRK